MSIIGAFFGCNYRTFYCKMICVLANPLLTPESALNGLNSDILAEFNVVNYTAPRMVLATSGIEYEELLSIAEPLLSNLHSIQHHEEPKFVYVGGDYRCQADLGCTHFALAFEVPRGWHKEKDAITLIVLQHSRIQSFSAFNSVFNKTGLFGIYGSTDPDSEFKDIFNVDHFIKSLRDEVQILKEFC